MPTDGHTDIYNYGVATILLDKKEKNFFQNFYYINNWKTKNNTFILINNNIGSITAILDIFL